MKGWACGRGRVTLGVLLAQMDERSDAGTSGTVYVLVA